MKVCWRPGRGAHYFSERHASRWRSDEGRFNPSVVNDPKMDGMIDSLEAARVSANLNEYQQLFRAIDSYAIEQQWVIWGPDVPKFHVTQPWVVGYYGEYHLGRNNYNALFARLWIDQALKEGMDH